MRRVLVLAIVVAAPAIAGASALGRGDAAWARRAEGQVEGRPQPEPVGEAVVAYAEAVAAEPARLEARWKLLRALWFSGEFVAPEGDARRRVFARAREAGEAALDALGGRVGGRGPLDATPPAALRARLPEAEVGDAARVYFWAAINLGAWARTAGVLDAVRAGVMNALHAYAERVIALDAGVDDGGAMRLLSRLHATLPRLPLLSGWVDRTQALPLAERARAAYPAHPGNDYVVALALLELVPARRSEALALLERTAALEPRTGELVEDLAIRRDARARLAAEGATGA